MAKLKPEHERLIQEVSAEIPRWQSEVQTFDEEAARRLGQNLTDLHCLGLLVHQGPMTAGQLAEAAGRTPGAITAAIDRWEEAGYAERIRSATDRRSVLVKLTAKANKAFHEIWNPTAQDGYRLLQGYSLAELALIRDFVRRCRELQIKHITRIRAEAIRAGPAVCLPHE